MAPTLEKTVSTRALAEARPIATTRFSVIVPVYNGRRDLEACLQALRELEQPACEVLVIDDASEEPLEDLVRAAGFHYQRLPQRSGPSFARNRGAERARGEFLVFIDADVCVHKNTLTAFRRAFERVPAPDAVIGSYDEAPADPGFVSQYKNLLHHNVHMSSAGPIGTFWSGCGAIRRELFLEVGGFDEQRYTRPAIEDLELGTWLSRAGHTIVLDPEVRCKHLKHWSLWNMIRTDVVCRGIPWVRLALRSGGFDDTLNTRWDHRLSLVLVHLIVLCLAFCWLWTPLALVAGVCGLTVLFLQRDLYGEFLRLRGLGFALRALPLHWLYFLYGGLCVTVGGALHLRDRWSGGGEAASALRPRTAQALEQVS